jgi:regulator of protease activity HflC (stomatin/prohibitin superfamily)
MNKQLLFLIIPLLIGISSSLYTLNEGEQAIILKFGEPISDKPIDKTG